MIPERDQMGLLRQIALRLATIQETVLTNHLNGITGFVFIPGGPQVDVAVKNGTQVEIVYTMRLDIKETPHRESALFGETEKELE